VVPFGIVTAGSALLSPPLMAIGLFTAILSSAIPYSLEMVALKRIPANRYGILMSIEPAIGAIAGSVLLAERLWATQWLAIGLVMAASVGSVLTTEKAA
jgi:inner membrane transporter RhtA